MISLSYCLLIAQTLRNLTKTKIVMQILKLFAQMLRATPKTLIYSDEIRAHNTAWRENCEHGVKDNKELFNLSAYENIPAYKYRKDYSPEVYNFVIIINLADFS